MFGNIVECAYTKVHIDLATGEMNLFIPVILISFYFFKYNVLKLLIKELQ